MRLQVILLLLLFVAPGAFSATAGPGRTTLPLNGGWAYLENNTALPEEARAAPGWSPVTLPHSWNVWDTTDLIPGYRRDAGWYRRSLDVPDAGGSRRSILYFEGAAMKADVYVNGRRAGGHIGGYVGFEVDITDFLQPGSNELLVRVSNAYDPDVIPSQKADYFLYGGLTRDVWLRQVPSTYLDRVLVRTPEVSARRAQTTLNVQVERHDALPYVLVARLMDPGGRVLQTVRRALSEGEDGAEIGFKPVRDPQLWSPSSPSLYEVEVALERGGEEVDRVREPLGYRFFRFEPHGAFFLNGERLLLRGTHRHEDHAGYASALPDSLHRRDMKMIKELGANFVRLGHYPQDPTVYRMADSLGLIVWDELPWNRGGVGEEAWKRNTERLLREQIRQNYNHPSIFFWSLGNEIYWLPDFPGGDRPEAINPFLQRLHDVAHELDPGRLTALRKYYDGADIVDVFSPSIWSGWYSGVYTKYEDALEKAQREYPQLLHMEYGGSSHVGRHTENPISGEGFVRPDEGGEEAVNQVLVQNIAQNGDWSENYIVDLFDWYLRVSETTPDLAGNAQWAFKDFGTPLRPENDLPYVNQKGLVDRAGRPKDAYYVFKSYWTDASAGDPAFCYIESHTWTERQGPAGEPREINVFCNTESTRLIVNGQDLGLREKDIDAFPASGLVWTVPFAEGANELVAIGYTGGAESTRDSLQVHYSYTPHGSPAELRLSARTLGTGEWLVEALMVDEAGRRVLDYEEPVYFSLDGDGRLLEGYGVPDASRRVAMANGRATIRMTLPTGGRAVVSAINQDFKGTYLVLPAEGR